MKYLKLFETDAEYQQFIGGGGDEFLKPNVSLVTDTNSLFYNPLIQEEKELPYLTITALEDDLTVSLSLNPCQYSLNGTDWNELQADEQTPAINTGDKIYFKAEGLAPNGQNGIGTFTVSKRFNLSGNVMSMLFGDEAEGKIDLTGYNNAFSYLFQSCTGLERVSKNFLPATELASSCYYNMFYNCTSLVNAPYLPATTLDEKCYYGMFQYCYSLVTVPSLPATTLAENCYYQMFNGCTSLVQTPELSATTLVDGCYKNMFIDCTSLVNAPELPATTLAEDCYRNMFNNCTSLVTAPELPATTLATGCYNGMFKGCTSLVTAPELPATKLASVCYEYMFHNCSKLNYIKAMFTTKPSLSYTNYWVDNVSPTGTFVKSKDATWNVTGKNGIPTGWTVETV